MVERQIKQEEVTAEMIQDQLTFTNKIETIKGLMEFSTTRNSYESMLDENDEIAGDLDVKTEVFDGLDKSTEEKLDFSLASCLILKSSLFWSGAIVCQ